MTLPTPEECRGPAMPNGVRPVLWEVVDPWLFRLKKAGDLRRLGDALQISRLTLYNRRMELGLPRLPHGRAEVHELTAIEAETLRRIEGGMTQAQIAEERGVTPQAVCGVVTRAQKKLATVPCGVCNGYGAHHCGADGAPQCGDGKHFHACIKCSGNGRVSA